MYAPVYRTLLCYLAQLSELFIWADQILSVCVLCLDVNQDGTNRNCCTQRIVILHVQTYWRTLMGRHTKTQVNVAYFTGENPKIITHMWAWTGIFKPAEPHSPRTACSLFTPSQWSAPQVSINITLKFVICRSRTAERVVQLTDQRRKQEVIRRWDTRTWRGILS